MHPGAILLAIQLLYLGQFHPDEIDTKSGDRWMALVGEGSGSSLRAVTIHIKRAEDIMDRGGEKTGKEVSVTSTIEPTSIIVMIRGLELHEGKVPTATFEGEGDVGKPLHVTLPGAPARYKLSMTCKSDDRCPLVLSTGGEQQQIFNFVRDPEAGDFKGLRIIWAGDLDGDGKLDLLVDTTNHYNASDMTLYLSSKAKSGQLVGQAARLQTVGC